MPCDYKQYPDNWKTEIRPAILKRAGNKCEECEVENHAVGSRSLDGKFYSEKEIGGMNSDVGYGIFGSFDAKVIKIVLTISHTDHDINNNEYSNLKALCQRCHNRHDIEHRKANIRKRKERVQPKLF